MGSDKSDRGEKCDGCRIEAISGGESDESDKSDTVDGVGKIKVSEKLRAGELFVAEGQDGTDGDIRLFFLWGRKAVIREAVSRKSNGVLALIIYISYITKCPEKQAESSLSIINRCKE